MMFNPSPRIERVAIAPGHSALVIDDALSEPERWVELAAKHRGEFGESPTTIASAVMRRD